jgi:two-component system, NarL family, nitrate/nitrite response regulator NarL
VWRVTLVSASSVTRAGLKALLGEAFIVTLETPRLRAAIHTDADLIVLDGDALEDADLEGCAVLLLSDDPVAVNRLRALAPSAWGVIPETPDTGALRAAARAVAQGFVVLPPELNILEPIRASNDFEPLTARELEVLRLLVDGMANKRIALELGIAESTVKYHLEGIYAKLGVRSRSQALRVALERGLVLL